MSEPLAEVAARLAAGETLADADALALATTVDILALGMLADEARRRQHGVTVTFVRVADVPMPGPGETPAVPIAAGEVRLVGAPESLAAAVAAIRRVLAVAGSVPVSAFSLSKLVRLAESERVPLVDVLRGLRDGGLELLSEAPLDELPDANLALAAALEAGLQIARFTIARPAPVAARLGLIKLAVRLQREVGGIRSIAPLPRAWDPAVPTTGYEDVRFVAASRLLAQNVPSIQVDWSRYGPKLAQVALTFGADDVDGVSPVDDAREGPRRAALEEIRRNIRSASLEPVERNGRYDLLAR
jgi:aminodeoxyfutalosine synthase